MCVKREVIGLKFNKLTVLDEKHETINGKRRNFLLCKCDCGNKRWIDRASVLYNRTKSCGCEQEKIKKNLGKKRKLPYGEASFNECYSSYKAGAKRRGYPFELTKEEFKKIVVQPCIYCGDSLTQRQRKRYDSRGVNGDFVYTGIDRYDNTKGYVIGNCVPCCKKCNGVKTDMTIGELEDRLTKILTNKSKWKGFYDKNNFWRRTA